MGNLDLDDPTAIHNTHNIDVIAIPTIKRGRGYRMDVTRILQGRLQTFLPSLVQIIHSYGGRTKDNISKKALFTQLDTILTDGKEAISSERKQGKQAIRHQGRQGRQRGRAGRGETDE